jgi:medium-chain acyl-[acyl-carrier-protein] hydrolase
MGAILAFEVARQLRREFRVQPARLFVSGCRAPQIPDREPPIYNLSEPKLLEELRRLNGTPRELLEDPDSMQFMLPLLRADFELIETYAYTPEPSLDVPIRAFSGLQDAEITRADVEGWREQTTAAFSLSMLSGDHFFLQTAQSTLLQLLAHRLSQRIDEAV